MKIGYIGLGKMGFNMVERLLEQGIEVVAWNRSPEPLQKAQQIGAITVNNLEDIPGKLSGKKIIWMMLPAGEVIDQTIEKLLPNLQSGDVLIDGANSFYKDTLARAKKLSQSGIKYLDIGVSGGPGGARDGACLMIGATKKQIDEDLPEIEQLAKAIAAPDAYGYFGNVGSGHFTKMVHNGIEYGMMQAIAEGAAVLEKSDFNLNLSDIFRVYNNQSVISSRLVGWTREALQEDSKLTNINPKITASGEGHWTSKIAKEMGVEIPVIDASVFVRDESEDVVAKAEQTQNNNPSIFRNKVVSAQRGKFGHHPVTINVKE
jgi:6-phosphogluconate dehydrogenase